MDLARDYFEWVFSLGFAGLVVMLGVTAIAALLALGILANAILWPLVGIKKLFGGDISGRTKAERDAGLTLDEAKVQRQTERAERDAKHAAKKAAL